MQHFTKSPDSIGYQQLTGKRPAIPNFGIDLLCSLTPSCVSSIYPVSLDLEIVGAYGHIGVL